MSHTLLRLLERLQAGPGLGLTRIPGVRPLHRLVAAGSRAAAGLVAREPIVVEWEGHRVAIDPADRGTAPALLLRSGYERSETAAFAETVRLGATVIDIGANVGLYTLLAARAAGPSGRVYAFEPEPDTYELLVRNIAANGYRNVVALQKAVTDRSGRVDLYRCEHSRGLASPSDRNARLSGRCVSVETVSLDEFAAAEGLARVDVIKIDVQGAEALVVAGGDAVLASEGLTVFLEYWPAGLRNLGTDPREFLERLAALGFRLHAVDWPDVELSVEDVERAFGPDGGGDLVLSRRPRR